MLHYALPTLKLNICLSLALCLLSLEQSTHVVLSHSDNIILCNSPPTFSLHIRHWCITHNLPVHVAHRTAFFNKYTVPKHRRRARTTAGIRVNIPDREDWD